MVHILSEDSKIKLVAGEKDGKKGPVQDLSVDIDYLDVELTGKFNHKTDKTTVLIYLIAGELTIGNQTLKDHHCALLSNSGDILVTTDSKARFLLIAGDPLNEPVAWGGPIVMNTEDELQKAFEELRDGSFINGDTFHKVHEEYCKD